MEALQDVRTMISQRSNPQQDTDRRWADGSYLQKVADVQAGRVRLGFCLLDRTPGQSPTLRTTNRLPSYIAQVNLSGYHTRLVLPDIG